MEIFIKIEGTPFRAEVIENPKSWGNGATFKIYDKDGSVVHKFDVVAHPEFNDYEKYQSMTLKDISKEIAKRLESGQYLEALRKSKESGIAVIFLLNPDRNETHNN